MAGQIKKSIDKIIQERSKGNKAIMMTIQTKLLLKGIDPKVWTEASDDDPQVMAKVRLIAQEFGIII